MTAEEFRTMALAMPGATEVGHMGHPDFRAASKIFATLGPDGTWGMVKLTAAQQAVYVGTAPGAFVPAKGAWGRGGATIVSLDKAREEVVGEALTAAWRNVTTPRSAASKRPRNK